MSPEPLPIVPYLGNKFVTWSWFSLMPQWIFPLPLSSAWVLGCKLLLESTSSCLAAVSHHTVEHNGCVSGEGVLGLSVRSHPARTEQHLCHVQLAVEWRDHVWEKRAPALQARTIFQKLDSLVLVLARQSLGALITMPHVVRCQDQGNLVQETEPDSQENGLERVKNRTRTPRTSPV